jgi:hypothetical protein
MATKKTEKTEKPKTAAKAAPKGAPKAKPTKAAATKVPRHPKARVAEKAGSKEALAKTVAEALVREDEDSTSLATRLSTASNQQLLRLARVAETVKQKYGSRAKLVAAIGNVEKKSKDKDFLAKLDSLSLPNLLDLATSAERRART